MTGTPGNNPLWHRTTILVRADILERAREHKTDIDGVCNQALADLLDIDLRQQPLGSLPAPVPVMVAPDGALKTPVKPARELRAPQHPVINADDPAAVTTVIEAKKIPRIVRAAAKDPAAESSREGRPTKQEPPQPELIPTPKSPAKKKKAVAGKREKEDTIKKFIAETVSRGEPDDATVPKDEMYERFTRWCRDRRIVPVPERRRFTLALKNQFALSEKTVGGIPCWMNIRLK